MEGVRTRNGKRQKQKSAKKKGKRADDDVVNDQMETDSVCSAFSSNGASTNDEMDDGDVIDVQENCEQLLVDALDRCLEKNVAIRSAAYGDLKKTLSRRVMSGFMSTRRESFLDIIEKSIKRGVGNDRVTAAQLCSLVCIQLGEEDTKHIFLSLKSSLINVVNDGTAPVVIRGSFATALGISAFIGAAELEDICSCLSSLRQVFSKKLSQEAIVQDFYSNAVLAWGLILTIAPPSVQVKDIEENLMLMQRLLEKGELNLRIAAGEVIALLFEIGRENRERFRYNNNDLRGLLKELATDSSRYKSKRDKKQQRSSFRDISLAVEGGHSPDDIVKFGSEEIELYNWARFRQYNALKDVLGAGVNAHLQENILVRQIFDLGFPIVTTVKQTKESRWEKQMYNQEKRKERTKSRNKTRENKRAASNMN